MGTLITLAFCSAIYAVAAILYLVGVYEPDKLITGVTMLQASILFILVALLTTKERD